MPAMSDPRALVGRLTSSLPDGPIKDGIARSVASAHERVFVATNGRALNRVMGMPVVALTTTGRKSGKARTTMLTAPVHDDDAVVLVASYGGANRDPLWYRNLQADPDCEILFKGRRRKMRARVATGPERDELWPRVVERYPGYDVYQGKTERQIPLVILEPRPDDGMGPGAG